jgi:predicted O-methyltransferase YrrM
MNQPPTTTRIDFTDAEQFEAARLLDLNGLLGNLTVGGVAAGDYEGSEMTLSERLFLNGVVCKAQPRKIVELGVAAGGSACIILNAIRDIPGATLDSVDYRAEYYRDQTKKSGWMVQERCPELAGKWRLFTGGMACRHLDNITAGGRKKIDLCLIDTVHSNPGEFLNILEVLPYMAAGGIVLLHDVSLHTMRVWENSWTNCALLAALGGERIKAVVSPDFPTILPNIGGVVLGDITDDLCWRLFSLLTLPWVYLPSDADREDLTRHFERHYGEELTKIFTRSFAYHMQRLQHRRFRLFGFTKDARHRNLTVLGLRFHFRR